MSEIELLAPAGNFECFRAAINAGANAVYLGGEKFGARAYAGNFTGDEIIDALKIAHIFDRKIYLTVNTLIKENEIGELVPYIKPLYEAGLDGVIVQDIGALEILRDNFPGLELHASTQMAITGMYGAEYMKKLGVCRVVPARELSLDEIRDIKDRTGLDIECFVHGAMCYAYSGQCLFSSILGGRSGNRGRCAGPCRLPYTDKKGNTVYPLSLKDMYTLPMLPELIKAGVYSFKIEGRMKSPEYVAGVTAMYRKYIDMYLSNPDNPYKVDKRDEQMLRNLYIRSDICNGYYKRHNDKSMITLGEPGYSGNSPKVVKYIQDTYIAKNITKKISGYVRIYADEAAMLTLYCDGISITVTGDVAGKAQKRPIDEEEINKRIRKLGDTCFELEELNIDTDGGAFMPVKSLNELRRSACVELEKQLCSVKDRSVPDKVKVSANSLQIQTGRKNELCVLVTTGEQLQAVNSIGYIEKIYVNGDIFLANKNSYNFLNTDKEYILALPHIFRKKSYKYIPEYEKMLKSGKFKGALVRNFEELQWLKEIGYEGGICSDYTVYAWNNKSISFYEKQLMAITLPLELNKRELENIKTDSRSSFVIYGYLPLMYSANCVQNTLEGCVNNISDRLNIYRLTDRYKNNFSIVGNCLHCYNILYNTVPLSLHGQIGGILEKGYGELRLDFSMENGDDTRTVTEYYSGLINKRVNVGDFPFGNFTNGHYKRGVE